MLEHPKEITKYLNTFPISNQDFIIFNKKAILNRMAFFVGAAR
jgi:hypothetical protein